MINDVYRSEWSSDRKLMTLSDRKEWGMSATLRHNITLTPTAVKINWTNMATKTTSHSTLVETKLGGTQPIYEQLMWEIKLYSHVAVMPRAWGITTCTGHNRHQL